jgi:hypothetical protein
MATREIVLCEAVPTEVVSRNERMAIPAEQNLFNFDHSG